MSEEFEIKNKVAESGLINFDLSTLVPKGKRIGIDLKDFLFEGLILKEKDFREKIVHSILKILKMHTYIFTTPQMRLSRFGHTS